jgi:hypothetical protein
MSDPLSDVLSLLRVESTRSTRLEARGPWALSFPAHHHIVFGAVLEGGMILTLSDGAEPVTLAAGDCYLLTRGRPYRMGNGARVRAESGRAVFEQRLGDDGVVRYGEGPLGLVWAGGSFRLEAESGDFLLNFLPPIIHLPSGTIDGSPLRAAYGLIRAETADRKPGASAIAGSIANIFVVQMLRAFLERSDRPSGWLGAMSDQRIGRALIAIHRDYARPWTVEQLAGPWPRIIAHRLCRAFPDARRRGTAGISVGMAHGGGQGRDPERRASLGCRREDRLLLRRRVQCRLQARDRPEPGEISPSLRPITQGC